MEKIFFYNEGLPERNSHAKIQSLEIQPFQRYSNWGNERPESQGSFTLWFEQRHIRWIKFAQRCVLLPNQNCSPNYQWFIGHWTEKLMEAAKKIGNNENDQCFNVLHTLYIQGFSEKQLNNLRKLGIGFVMKRHWKQSFSNWN